MELITCKSLSKDYGVKKALDNVSFQIPAGRIVGLLGSNGSGKTTLIKIMNELLVPTSGEILIEGQRPGIESKKVISYLPERTYLPYDKKVAEVIAYFKDFYSDFNVEKAYKLLGELGIKKEDKLKQMSKGTKEKVQLVLVMSREADIYILDEPIGGVDPVARDQILDLILKNFKEGASLIISTHLIADIEKILDDVIFIHQGKVLLNSSADEVRNKYHTSIENAFKEVFKQC
ncbi:MAG: ABC transporter ATP-binding protein [Clostridia bacterium]|nr:ABC transporter ATP-binding protein [Clostridia bacterium]